VTGQIGLVTFVPLLLRSNAEHCYRRPTWVADCPYIRLCCSGRCAAVSFQR